MAPIDLVVVAILAIAALRGLYLGVIRETFSLLALAGAVVAVRLLGEPLATQLVALSGERIGPWLAWGIGLAVLAVAVFVAARIIAHWLRKGARAVGLAWVDRMGGAALGLAEGALVAALLLLLIMLILGPDARILESSHAADAFHHLQDLADREGSSFGDVAAP